MIATISFVLLILSFLIEIIFLLRDSRTPDPFSHFLLLAASLLLFTATLQRSFTIRFVALTSTFESLIFFSGMICLILFLYRLRSRQKAIPFIVFGGTAVAIILLALASSPLLPKEALSPIPALRSHWLVLHVSFAFVGEAFFAVAFSASIYYLAIKDQERRKRTDRIIYTSIAIGYPFFTAGALIFGAIWAQYAWGSYWSWDPKETWALITWIIYTGYLHTRLVKKMKGAVSAILALAGFAFTMFTFFGVNYLLTGLHSY